MESSEKKPSEKAENPILGEGITSHPVEHGDISRWTDEVRLEKLTAAREQTVRDLEVLQGELANLKSQYEEGNEKAIRLTDPKMKALSVEVGRGLNALVEAKKKQVADKEAERMRTETQMAGLAKSEGKAN